MVLSANELKERIQKPVHKTEIQLAIKNQNRVNFHTKTAVSAEYLSPYYTTFKQWVEGLLPSDKQKRFLQLLTLPLSTNEVCDAIFSELNKAFKSNNKRIEVLFSRSEYKAEFNQYLEEIEFDKIFEQAAKELMRTGHNSLIVCDLPALQEGVEFVSARPYFYPVSIASIIDIELDSNQKVEYAIFKDASGKIISVDKEKYCVFKNVDESTDYVIESEIPHELGYAPAEMFWKQTLDSKMPIIKASPINKSLGAFDWFLFFSTSRRYLEMYASYPIITSFINECEFKNEQGNPCEGGYTAYNLAGTQFYDEHNPNSFTKPCPACEKNKLIGPGTRIGVSAPSKDEPNLIDAVKVIPAERQSLDYNQEEEERKKNLLIYYNSGVKESDLKQAQNEMQIIKGFESSQSILENIADNLQSIHRFILDTYADLIFKEYHVATIANYGDEYYEISEDELQKEYEFANKNNAPVYIKETIRTQIFQQKYKNDPRMAERMKILRDLEPYPSLSIDEVLKLNEKLFDANIFSLKINLAKFVSIFESENGDIVEFASSDVPYSTKIETIKTTLLEYGKRFEPIATDSNSSI